MKCSLLILLTLQSIVSFGQLAIITDKDGYCNVRKEGKTGGENVDTLHNGHLIFCHETKDNWTNIDFAKKKGDRNGFVYHDRVKLIADYDSVPVISDQGNAITLGRDSIKIVLTTQKFDKAKYRFLYAKSNKSDIQLINGKQYWGTDGEQPKKEYKSVLAIIGHRRIVVPGAALENLFEPSLFHSQVNYDRGNDILYIQSMNSDGAGSYYIIWKIERGVYIDRYIVYGF